MSKKIPTLSLFSGAGGLDIGFHKAGFDIRASVEIEPSYCETLRANTGREKYFGVGGEVICQDIREFDASKYKNSGIRCVIGGPPCQTFSAAGRRSGGVIGINDDRGQLFLAYCEILGVIRPEVFVFENVYGLIGANGGKPWQAISKAFADLGYTLTAEVVDAADYGVPQHRERLIIVGSLKGQFVFPMPTHGPDSNSGLRLVSVSDAIKDLQGPKEPTGSGLGGLYGHLLPLVPEGLNYAFFTAEMGHPEPLFAWRSKFHDLLYKVDRKEPCRTIKAQPGKFTGPFHWKNRHFTVPELKRLQSFPDEYLVVGNYNKAVEQIGNSVPPRLASVMATSVREQLLVRPTSLTYEKRPAGFRSTFRPRQRERTNKFKQVARNEITQRYSSSSAISAASAQRTERYSVSASSFFDQRRTARRTDGAKFQYDVTVRDQKSRLILEFVNPQARNGTKWSMGVEIDGLAKYLGRIDSVSVAATLVDTRDVFFMWSAIENALIKRSRFFTLIDIYGHYANRGDTIRVATSVSTTRTATHRALAFLGDSLNCGDFLPSAALEVTLQVGEDELSDLIQQLRDLRYDVRTQQTHPIIGPDRVLCTYPFPLLSPRALVESRARFVVSETDASYQPLLV